MDKNKKTIALGLGGVAIVLIAMLVLNFGNIVKGTAEKIASDALGVRVQIAKLDVSLADKTARVKGLKIANPKGFNKPYALKAESITIALEDVLKKLITFKTINVVGTEAFLEVTKDGSNLGTLKNTAKAKADAKPKKNEKEAGKAPKVIIRNLAIETSIVHPTVTLVGGQDLEPVEIPAVRLRRIGEKSNGILAAEAVAFVMGKYLHFATRAAKSSGFLNGQNGMVGKAKDSVKQLGEDIGGLLGN